MINVFDFLNEEYVIELTQQLIKRPSHVDIENRYEFL
jgi:hypothetical protein